MFSKSNTLGIKVQSRRFCGSAYLCLFVSPTIWITARAQKCDKENLGGDQDLGFQLISLLRPGPLIVNSSTLVKIEIAPDLYMDFEGVALSIVIKDCVVSAVMAAS